MQKQKGNMYEWVTHTYNPIKGLCTHHCSYCYMNPIYHRFKQNPDLRLDVKELGVNLGSDNVIFVGSSTDLFAKEVPSSWIQKVFDHCLIYNQNEYLFQSKNPARFLEPDLISHQLMGRKESVFFATTIETNREEPKVSDAPAIRERIDAMIQLRQLGFRAIITMEPLLDFDEVEVLNMMALIAPMQVNIGFNTNRAVHLPEPTKEKTLDLIHALEKFTTVVVKSNSSRVLGGD